MRSHAQLCGWALGSNLKIAQVSQLRSTASENCWLGSPTAMHSLQLQRLLRDIPYPPRQCQREPIAVVCMNARVVYLGSSISLQITNYYVAHPYDHGKIRHNCSMP